MCVLEKDEKDRELRQGKAYRSCIWSKYSLQPYLQVTSGENKYAVVHWLATTEPSVALDAARKKHYGSTGKWFLENPIIQSWQIQDSSLLWLYGKSGCGKHRNNLLLPYAIDNAMPREDHSKVGTVHRPPHLHDTKSSKFYHHRRIDSSKLLSSRCILLL